MTLVFLDSWLPPYLLPLFCNFDNLFWNLNLRFDLPWKFVPAFQSSWSRLIFQFSHCFVPSTRSKLSKFPFGWCKHYPESQGSNYWVSSTPLILLGTEVTSATVFETMTGPLQQTPPPTLELQSCSLFRTKQAIVTLSSPLLSSCLPLRYACNPTAPLSFHGFCKSILQHFHVDELPPLEFGFLSHLLASIYKSPGNICWVLLDIQIKSMNHFECGDDPLNGQFTIYFPWIMRTFVTISHGDIFLPFSHPWELYLPHSLECF